MAIVLTCHLIETIWNRRNAGTRAPFMVIDHNGQQHQTEVMKAGAVTVWNTRATFPYAPSSDLVVMAFDAAGRQPGAFIAQAVVDVAVMLQEGSLNASAALVNRKGQSVGVVMFDVGLVTSSRALAAGLDIPALQFSTHTPSPGSPTGQLQGPLSPTTAAAAAVGGRSSPFAELAVQRGLAQPGPDLQQPTTPSSAQSMGSKLVGSISQALVGALLGLETRDREDLHQQQQQQSQGSSPAARSYSSSPRRLGTVSRSLDCLPTRQQRSPQRGSPDAHRPPPAAAAAGSSLLSRRSVLQQGRGGDGMVEQQPSPPSALRRTSTTAVASAPPAGPWAERASFSAWKQPTAAAAAADSSSNHSGGPLTAGRPAAAAAAAAAGGGGGAVQQPHRRAAASADGRLGPPGDSSSSSTGMSVARSGSSPQSAGLQQGSHNGLGSRAESHRPSRLTVPAGDCAAGGGSGSSSTSPNPGSSRTLSPLTEARSRLRLARPQPLPPLSQLFPEPRREEGLIPVGRAPPSSPGGYSQATTAGFSCAMSQGPEAAMSADYDALLREFDAADAAGKEAILFRELMVQQQERQAGSSQLLSKLSQQQRQEVLEHQQLMDALEGMTHGSNSPVSSPARAAADAFRSCFSSSTQISSSGGSSDGGSRDTPFKHYPNLPEFNTAPEMAAPAAIAAPAGVTASRSATKQQRSSKQGKASGSPSTASAAAGAAAVGSPNRPAAGGLLQQLSSAEGEGSPLFSARQGRKLLGDRVGQQGSAQSTPMSEAAAAAAAAEAVEAEAAAARQLNWQLLERMQQQEMAAAAAAAPVESYAISHAGTEISEGVSDADASHDDEGSQAAAAAAHKSARQATVAPAYTCRKGPGQLGGYNTSSTRTPDQAAAAKKSRNRWVQPGRARDVLPYPQPPPAFPAVAVSVAPSAPLMAVPEEYPCA